MAGMRLVGSGLARWEGRAESSRAASPLPAPAWSLPDLSGRLVELSAGAEAGHLTAAFGLVLEAQLHGDRAAWVTLSTSTFFPPDAADGGIDLHALPVVRVPDARAVARAAEHLVRSGGFGLVVADLASAEAAVNPGRPGSRGDAPAPTVPVALLTRLLGLARQQDVAVLLLTRKSHETPSLHSLISLRAEARHRARGGLYELGVRVLKDKRSGPGWTHTEICRGPAGLR